MSFPYGDLDLMVLERVNGENLSNVGRVNKQWRTYIANYEHRMRRKRQISIPLLSINFMANDTKSKVNYYTKSAQCIMVPLAEGSINIIRKFKPESVIKFKIHGLSSPERRREIELMTNDIPDWWIEELGKIDCTIHDVVFSAILSRIPHLSELRFEPQTVWSDDYLTRLSNAQRTFAESRRVVRSSQKVDQFLFPEIDTFNASVLETVIEKSQMYPTKFPKFVDRTITVAQFINFLEHARMIELPFHHIEADLIGDVDEWNSWLTVRTTEAHVPGFKGRTQLSSSMSDFPRDLELMVLDRIKTKDLSEVARVKKPWRKYIAENGHKWGPIHCVIVDISFFESLNYGMRSHVQVGISKNNIKSFYNLNGIYKYIPQKLILGYYPETMSDDKKADIEDMLRTIPSWYMQRLDYVNITIHDVIFRIVISQIENITMLNIQLYGRGSPQQIEDTKTIIRSSNAVENYLVRIGAYDQSVRRVLNEKVPPFLCWDLTN